MIEEGGNNIFGNYKEYNLDSIGAQGFGYFREVEGTPEPILAIQVTKQEGGDLSGVDVIADPTQVTLVEGNRGLHVDFPTPKMPAAVTTLYSIFRVEERDLYLQISGGDDNTISILPRLNDASIEGFVIDESDGNYHVHTDNMGDIVIPPSTTMEEMVDRLRGFGSDKTWNEYPNVRRVYNNETGEHVVYEYPTLSILGIRPEYI